MDSPIAIFPDRGRMAPLTCRWDDWSAVNDDAAAAFDRDFFNDNAQQFLIDLQTGPAQATIRVVWGLYLLASNCDEGIGSATTFYDRIHAMGRFHSRPAIESACSAFADRWEIARERHAESEARNAA